jgi:uncharacterized protein
MNVSGCKHNHGVTATQRTSAWRTARRCALAAAFAWGCGKSGTAENVVPTAPPSAATSNPAAIVPVAPVASPTPPVQSPAGMTGAAAADPMFTKEAMLAAVGACAVDRFKDFQTQATALKTAADAWAASPADMAAADGARAAWKTAMASWQEAELFRIGPAAAMFTGGPMIPGGKNLRNEIYAFPLRNTCTIDQLLANEGYETFTSVAFDSRGLGAIEYLAFNVGTAHTCTGNAASSIESAWNGLGTMLAQRRAAYSAAAAADIVTRSAQLVMEWDAAGGNFVGALAAGSAPYSGTQSGLQAISDAIFYLDKELKDFKLGRPLELTMDCASATPGVLCGAEAVESRIAGVSTDNIRANLRAFRRVFEGCGDGGAGLGVDAWLKESGFEDLAMRMLTALNDAQAAADSFPALESTLMADKAMVMDLHAKIKVLGDLMKMDFLSSLELTPPPPMTPTPAAAPPAGGTGGDGTAGSGMTAPPMMPGFPGGFDGD